MRMLLMFVMLCCSIFLGIQGEVVMAEEPPKPPVILYLFWGEGCPHCEDEREFLQKIRKEYPDLEMRWFEIWNHPEFAKLADALAKAHNIKATSVPITLIGDWNMVGFQTPETTGAQMLDQVDACLKNGCKDVLDSLGPQVVVEKIRAEAAKNAPEDWEYFPAATAKKDEQK